jgi:phosphoribosylformylglycinamidine (FGAM) synthase-like amidotransferase family enzyme
MATKLTTPEIKALQALARNNDTYAVNHPGARIPITDGEGFMVIIEHATIAELERKGFVAKRYHPLYFFITAAGLKALERAGK